MPDPVPSLAELFSPSTAEEVTAEVLRDATSLGFPVTAWEALDPLRVSIQLFAQQGANWTQIIALIARSGLLQYAVNTDGTTNPWLTVVAKQVYGVDRIEASFGKGRESLTNASGSAYVIIPGQLHFANPTSGKTYTNTSGGTIAASGGTLTLDIEADEIGADSTSVANTITRLVTPLSGVTCTNADPVIGQDIETDQSLVDRCITSMGALSPNGAEDAYRYIALSFTTDDERRPCTRVSVSPWSPTGQVTVYLAGPDGDLASDDFDAVKAELIAKAVPNCVTPTITNAQANVPDVTGSVFLSKNYTGTPLEAQTAISNALALWFATLPIGGTATTSTSGKLYKDALVAQIFAALPKGTIVDVNLTQPATDVNLDPNQVPVYGGSPSDFTIIQLST